MTDETAPQSACQGGDCGQDGGPGNAMENQDKKIEHSLAQIKHKLLIMSGKGGVGKSSLSANIAVALARRGFKVGLLDVDIHGPSIAHIMGVQGLLDISEDRGIIPKAVDQNLKVVSMQSLLQNGDDAIIWRGPAKTGVIRQFVSEVQWGELDFLLIDSPPGTGDEPLSVAQTISGAKAVIITTPQDVALSDVRKSINFCRTVKLDVLGLIENMGPFACPCCGKTIDIFKSGGGERTSKEMDVAFLGTIPFDPKVVKSADAGKPLAGDPQAGQFSQALDQVLSKLVEKL